MKYFDIALCALLAVLIMPLAVSGTNPARVAVGLLFVMFLPGYTFTTVLFPRRGTLGRTERLAWSLGASVALVEMVGLALNFTPWGLTELSVIGAMAGLQIVFSGTACYRRLQDAGEANLLSNPRPYLWRPNIRAAAGINRLQMATIALTSVGVLILALYALGGSREEPFTEFYILGEQGKARNYAKSLSVDENAEFTIAVVNQEQRPVTYRIQATIDGHVADQTGPLTLKPAEKWQGQIVIQPFRAGANQKLEFFLYTGDRDEPYRSLHLWLDVWSTA